MRLLKRETDGELVLTKHKDKEVPVYAILSHTWGDEEVTLQDLEAGTGTEKLGWRKIQFCAAQSEVDGLQYFWIDTCCIDKRDSVELSAAINSMFRWYQRAMRCYVYLDVSKSQEDDCNMWEHAFRKSRWFTRAWTLQELIAPASVEFFTSEGERLGNKLTLEALIYEITGVARNALLGHELSSFSVSERMSWAEGRQATLEEDEIYSLLGIFGIAMPLIYGEGRRNAARRLEEEVHKSYRGELFPPGPAETRWLTSLGGNFSQYAVGLKLSTFPEPAQFVAREHELVEMHRLLHGRTTRSAVTLQGLGGIGKTQLALEYARRHKDKYTAVFWLNATDESSLRLSFHGVAQQILEHQPSTSTLASVDLEGDSDQVVQAVKAWLDLRLNTGWLMIFDNYDNPKIPSNLDESSVDLRPFLPEYDHGSVIVTTRLSGVNLGKQILVQKLKNIHEGLMILSNASKREGIENGMSYTSLSRCSF
jgi:hypothetical protein